MASTARAEESDTLTAWQAQDGPQTALISCPVFEIFFGGARGGGKTDGVLGDFLEHADTYGENAIGLMIRRERTQLIETIERSKQIYAPLGWKYHEQDKMWRAPDGARLRFAYLERDADADAYQGHSYTRVYVEEIGTFPSDKPILKLMATLRSGAGVPVGFRATGNPGGPGHQWVKARYIDAAPMGWVVHKQDYKNPFDGQIVQRDRVYIPSRLNDNHYLGRDYVANLMMSGNENLVKAWLDGDWSVIDGAFFSEWSNERHVIAPIALPDDWTRFRSFDWGSAAPFSVGWWAVVGDNTTLPNGKVLPRGAMIRYREWYGASAPNVGLKITTEEIAKGILDRSGDEQYKYTTCDPSIFAQQGGPSQAERMINAGMKGLRPADNARVAKLGAVGGWDQLRSRLKGDDNPMIFFFATCKDSIRTIPMLQHDSGRPEDLDTDGEDHAADEVRYACMSRPYVARPPAPPAKPKDLIFEVQPNGRITSNMSVRDRVEQIMKQKRRDI
jgi:hypothetical protein